MHPGGRGALSPNEAALSTHPFCPEPIALSAFINLQARGDEVDPGVVDNVTGY